MRTHYTHNCAHCGNEYSNRNRESIYCSVTCSNLGRPRRSVEARFWSFVAKTGECWLWTGGTNGYGYGSFQVGGRKGKRWIAPRFSYTLAHGAIPPGMNVCHRCDVPGCVNPAHLFLGTQADNLQDMAKKGRHWVQKNPGANDGERNPRATLTDVQVLAIRAEWSAGGVRQAELMRRYGVSKGVIWRIVHGRQWRHLNNPVA